MTLTSLLPTLRDSIPVPLDPELWPAGARAGTRDVTLSGISLLRYVELCGTPCVTTGSAVIPQSGGVASRVDWSSVVVASVTDIGRDGARTVRIDAVLGDIDRLGRELRMLGRVSHAPDRPWVVVDADGTRVARDAPRLPEDLRLGDIVALPCRGAVAAGDVRCGR
jgi:hypothetical protein